MLHIVSNQTVSSTWGDKGHGSDIPYHATKELGKQLDRGKDKTKSKTNG